MQPQAAFAQVRQRQIYESPPHGSSQMLVTSKPSTILMLGLLQLTVGTPHMTGSYGQPPFRALCVSHAAGAKWQSKNSCWSTPCNTSFSTYCVLLTTPCAKHLVNITWSIDCAKEADMQRKCSQRLCATNQLRHCHHCLVQVGLRMSTCCMHDSWQTSNSASQH